MRFKRNIMIAFVCYTTNCFLGLTPILASVYFLFRDTNNNILVLLFLILIFMTPIFILDIICLIIAFIVQIFMKTTYYVNDDCLVIKTKNESREIKYSEIAGITYYDYVYLGRWGFDLSKLQFVLFDKDNIKNCYYKVIDTITLFRLNATLEYTEGNNFFIDVYLDGIVRESNSLTHINTIDDLSMNFDE